MLNILQRAARQAGELLMKYFNQGVIATYKTSHKNIVTQADLASQKLIYQTIVSKMLKKRLEKKDIGFIGEEKLNIEGKHKFIIDPLDGTNNFASGYGNFCVSIAYAINNKIITGVIYNPNTDTLYLAQIGKGAFKLRNHSKTPLRLREIMLKNSLMSVIFNKDENIYNREFIIYKKLYPVVRAFREDGSTALDLCRHADNIFPLHINGNAYIWDVAAANLIVEEAGGRLSDWRGEKIFIDINNPQKRYQFFACHPKLKDEILKFFD